MTDISFVADNIRYIENPILKMPIDDQHYVSWVSARVIIIDWRGNQLASVISGRRRGATRRLFYCGPHHDDTTTPSPHARFVCGPVRHCYGANSWVTIIVANHCQRPIQSQLKTHVSYW